MVFEKVFICMSFLINWPGRYSHSSVVMPDGSVLVMGGETESSVTDGFSNEVWRSNNGASWSIVTKSAWSKGNMYPELLWP